MEIEKEVQDLLKGYEISKTIKDKLSEFVNFHLKKETNIAFITSGGTSVPLEEKTVRFIDNFSYGTRGSASAEAFIRQSYAVIFLYRKKTLTPYERHLSNVNLLDSIKYADDNNKHDTFKIEMPKNSKPFGEIFDEYQNASKNNLLLKIGYNSIFEYLSLLEFISKELDVLGKRALIYLAAAVSDFYLPKESMPKHKIQSSQGGLKLDLKPVPKLLGKLKESWCPNAYVISFKLETDENLLMIKSLNALKKYKHELVIANILETRKNQVIVIEDEKHNNKSHVIKLNNSDEQHEIEFDLVKFVVELHSNFLSV